MEVGPDLIQSMLFVCAFVSMLFDYQLGMYSISEHRETFDARSDSTGDSQRSSGAFIFQRRRSRFRGPSKWWRATTYIIYPNDRNAESFVFQSTSTLTRRVI